MKTLKKSIAIFLAFLMLFAAIPLAVSAEDETPAEVPVWEFDYTEKDGTVHHAGDEVTSKNELIKRNALSFLYSGRMLNAFFENVYAALGEGFTNSVWRDDEPIDVSIGYLYIQGIPGMIGGGLPIEPMFFRSGYSADVEWYKLFDGTYIDYYPNVMNAVDSTTVFTDKAAMFSASALGKKKTDISFWSVPSFVSVNGTTAVVPSQESRSNLFAGGTIVPSFTVDTVADVISWEAMDADPMGTWKLDPGDPNSLYKAFAACLGGYSTILKTALTGNSTVIECGSSILSDQFDLTMRLEGYSLYYDFLVPLYEALGIEDYPSFETIENDSALIASGKTYFFNVDCGVKLFEDILSPIVDWVENVLCADPAGAIASVADDVFDLFGFRGESPLDRITIVFRILSSDVLQISLSDIFKNAFSYLDLKADLIDYIDCGEGHSWDEGEITKAATCTETGIMTYTCMACQATMDETIGLKPHEAAPAVKENETAPSCEHDGFYDSVVYCENCPTELSRERVTLTKTGHSPVTVPGTPATCVDDGLTDGSVCSVCEAVLIAQEVIPATGIHVDDNGDGKCDICGANMEVCKWCGKVHGNGFLERLISLFHRILASAFGARY